MTTTTVRRAGTGDLLAVARLIRREPGLRDGELREQERAAWADVMATSGLSVFLADDATLGGDAIGTITLLLMPHLTYDCRPTAFIEAMYVVEECRRRGVGRRLVEHALEHARDAGCHKIQLLTHKRHADDGAHDFYRSLGFEAEAEGFRRYLAPPPS